jgi:hypothetical protein
MAMMKIEPMGYDMETGAMCGKGADSGTKEGYSHTAPEMSEQEAGAISIPNFTPAQSERPNG